MIYVGAVTFGGGVTGVIFVGGVMLIKLYSCFKYEVSFIWVKLSAFYLKNLEEDCRRILSMDKGSML